VSIISRRIPPPLITKKHDDKQLCHENEVFEEKNNKFYQGVWIKATVECKNMKKHYLHFV
jgi:hypothetical protein